MAGTNVPGIESTPQLSQNVPGVQFPFRQEFGRQGAAIQHLGEGIENVAKAGNEIQDEISRQHDLSTASKNYVDASVAHNQQVQNLKLTSPDGFIHDQRTGEITKNSDGSQRTISQEYWDWADGDYQDRQQSMSPRAAAMFRQQMLTHIGDNTKLLQNSALELQEKSADQFVKDSMATFSRDNDRTPWSDSNPYYHDTRPDGSINMRGNTDKINEQLRTIKLWTARQGAVGDKPGMYSGPQVQKMLADRLSEHSDQWVRSAVTDIMENDTPRDHKNRVSTTAVQQVQNLRDVIEGKDPQSTKLNSMGLPTVNSSLTAEQADKWRSQLNTMLDGAKKIDRSDYEFQLKELKDASRSGVFQTPDKLFQSPQFNYLTQAAAPLGLTPEEQLKNFSDIFSNAAGASYGGRTFDLSSEAAKRDQISQNVNAYAKAWEQYGGLMGAKFTGSMAPALKEDVTKGALSKLEEETKQFREDPAKYAAQVSSGYQDPTGKISYRSQTMKNVEDSLYADPSLFAALKPMPNGKPLIQNAIREMKRIGAQGFGQGFEPNYLSKNDYQAWGSKIEKSGNPESVEKMFSQLNKAAGPDAGTVMDQLVKYGNLDPRYQVAQNLPTASARIAAYSEIMSKGAAIEAYTKTEGAETVNEVMKKAAKSNQPTIDYNNRIFGADSPEASKANKMLLQTWASKYSAAMGVKGTSQGDAAKAASEAVASQIPPVAQVGEAHNFLGFSWGESGPQSKLQFSRPDLSPDQQESIRDSLRKAQGEFEISKHQLVPAPITPGAYDFNKKLNAKWVSEHPFAWYPVRQGTPQAAYRLQYQGMNADGSPNGKGYDVKVYAPDGSVKPYEIQESDALKKVAK